MAVKIRLMRVGKKKQPSYRLVVADARSPRDGRFIEIIGHYSPRQEPSVVTVDSDRALHWLANGAQPTEQAAKILEISGVWDTYKQSTGKAAAAKPKPKTPKTGGGRGSTRARGCRTGFRGTRRGRDASERIGRRGVELGSIMNDLNDDDFEEDDDDFDDEVAPEGNRVVGARARASVELIARHLVDDPDGVFVDTQERRDTVALLIHASPGDLGRVIGKRGRVIQAVRQLARASGSTEGVRVTVDVAE